MTKSDEESVINVTLVRKMSSMALSARVMREVGYPLRILPANRPLSQKVIKAVINVTFCHF